MTGRAPDPRSSSTNSETDLLARLGLGPGASNGEIEAAHDDILEFLAAAPGGLREWAELQLIDADEAYAQLNGAPPSGTLTAAPLRERDAPARQAAALPPVESGFDGFDEIDAAPGRATDDRGARGAAQASVPVRGQSRSRGRGPARGSTETPAVRASTLRRFAVVGAALALVITSALAVYGLGGASVPGLTGTPKPQASEAVDAAEVSALMQRIATNAKDVDALLGLANIYYDSGDYATAKTWLDKVLALEPKNVAALLTLGAAQYNSGDETSAEANWRKVLALDPDNLEAHYDLGFMYFSQEPPNTDGARAEWGKVVELAPDSAIAKTVAPHLAALGSPSPGGSAAPAGSGSPDQSSRPTSSVAPAPSASAGGN